jgi:threonine/homoserine/homoserine lactone efflux protein
MESTMLDWPNLALFFVTALALILMPGPAVLYIVARSVDQGRLAGLVSALGVNVGTLFHVAAAAFGLSAVLVTSALAFQVVKYLGAAYLIYLGVRKIFFEHDQPDAPIHHEGQPLSRIFTQGVVVNVLNPKTALFFFAFLPQFVSPERGTVALQFLLLGLMFVGMAACSDSLYALLAGTLGGWLKGRPGFLRRQRYFSGGIYIALGVTTALSGGDGK